MAHLFGLAKPSPNGRIRVGGQFGGSAVIHPAPRWIVLGIVTPGR
jgi:hypothetical protein